MCTGVCIGACTHAPTHVHTRAHTNTAQRGRSSCNLKECFFQGNTDNLLEAVLSVIQHRGNTGHRCPSRLVRSCGTGDQACLCSSPGALEACSSVSFRAAGGRIYPRNYLLALQFPPPLSFPACFLLGSRFTSCIVPRWPRPMVFLQLRTKEAPALSLCSRRPQPSTVGQN